LKELWVEISSSASSSEKDKLQKLAADKVDFMLKDNCARNSSGSEVTVLTNFDEKTIRQLKKNGRKIALKIRVKGKEDENIAVKAAELSADYIIIDCLNWRVIPLENLIARTRNKSKLIAKVENAEDAKLVLETLELGTDGVLIYTSNSQDLTKAITIVKKQEPKISVIPAKVKVVKPISTGARVCVDTCDLMASGEGMLVGVQAVGFFLIEAEVHENPYVQARPFRVNAGSLSMYTLKSLQTTQYLSELKAGEDVLIVNREGEARSASVGRIKIELRPLILVEAEVEGKKIKTILQNAETIRLVNPQGSTPVTELKAGDEVLVHLASSAGRHFGVSVPNETVIER
jgi:3-dehydroquinate synthase II